MENFGDQRAIPAAFIRGGTSKAIFFRRENLPADESQWAPILLAAMGSPDPNGRQLDGMGGGITSLSKVCVVGPSERPGVDVDYTFVQVAIQDASVSFAGNCGNISSAVGPYAVDEGLVQRPDGSATVALFNTNTKKRVDATFSVREGRAAVKGESVIPGVSGSGSPVILKFLDPAGAGTGELFPTDALTETFDITGLGSIRGSVVDAANLCCFLNAEDLDLSGIEMPTELDRAQSLNQALRNISGQVRERIVARKGPDTKVRLGLIGFISPPQDAKTLSGDAVHAGDANFTARMFSSLQPHRALPLTSSLCMAVAAKIGGTTVHAVAKGELNGAIRIATPSGILVVSAEAYDAGLSSRVTDAAVFRTQRRLFDGVVYVPADL